MDILLIEDNEAERFALKMAFQEVNPDLRLTFAEDGTQAADFLASDSLPKLIMLDLNLPGKSGREILSELKENSRLKHIPVLILTTSQSQRDICDSYKLQASCYLTKPFGLEPLIELAAEISAFWLKKVKFCHA